MDEASHYGPDSRREVGSFSLFLVVHRNIYFAFYTEPPEVCLMASYAGVYRQCVHLTGVVLGLRDPQKHRQEV